ncbi:MAG: Xaa-Pro peptidase family protein [Thermodesulfovibrio sp.]|nr:Xaa-Pro peptidase family protein [Thermodesulfovibrio sp.]MDW7998674.1 Xaa-Pro peptidase family protein [Thermodesulfovibrio sp.]
MANKYEVRVKKVFDKISSSSEAFLITNMKNIRYLTGFKGSFGIVLLTEKNFFLFIDFRYFEQAKKESACEIIFFKDSWIETISRVIEELQIKKLSFEVTCTYDTFLKLKESLKVELIPQHYVVENVRKFKEIEEIKNIQEAIKIAENAFLETKELIREGVTEKIIAKTLENKIKEYSDTLPFPVIVASGENSSMPHWRYSDRKLKKGDFVIIDWGAEYNGYFCDMTRTFIIKEASEKQKEIYKIVQNANIQAIKACGSDTLAKEIDAAARNLIKQFDYGDNFGHATGHGVGLDIHEFPKINAQSEEIIKPGMIFTIEPGIYIEGFGGVRIEDMVVVKENSVEILTNLSKELEIL